MRLICPNCTAQYEVEENAVPPQGRDVVCSACGHGWFHTGAQLNDVLVLAGDAPGAATPPRRPLDAAVVNILREEAEREARARRAATTKDPEPAPPSDAATAEEPVRDIGDITATLHATARLRTAERQAGKRRGWGMGFGFVTGAAAALLALYLLAPVIAREWPALAPAAASFTQQVNMARLWLDDGLREIGIQPRP
ncbi:zinc-ribbon domain-containing protein [Halodurantibacterium flavum]|uniref:Zinc-ribbon domain-containing protein n=1 Tax=Halodurantibacterium flavum TaxID=1382802 RepID=A0ABW4S860_9RHOB